MKKTKRILSAALAAVLLATAAAGCQKSEPVSYTHLIKELVALGMGITVIAHSACREEELAGRLAVIPIENARMMREINMVHHKSFTHTEILEEFRRIYTAIQSGQPLAPAAEDAALV